MTVPIPLQKWNALLAAERFVLVMIDGADKVPSHVSKRGSEYRVLENFLCEKQKRALGELHELIQYQFHTPYNCSAALSYFNT